MIKKLIIENFRTHESTELEFVKGINCIIGLPDSGKTNVIRAINWLLTNRPLGFRFHSDFTDGPTKVAIEFENGKKESCVSLTKSKKSAQYVLDGDVLKAIGADVPDVISSVTGMTDLNLQRQLDKPFLICSSSGEVAKTFNHITKLEKPDIAVSALTTDINSENKVLKNLKERKDKIQEDIVALGPVKEMDSDLEDMSTINDKLKIKENRIEKLSGAITDINWHVNNVKSFGDVDKVIESFDKLKGISEKINGIDSKIESLNRHIAGAKQAKETVARTKEGMDKVSDDFNKMEKMLDKWEDVLTSQRLLAELIEGIDNADSLVDMAKETLLTKAKEYRKFLNTIDVCPYCVKCKTPISEHNLDDSIKGLGI